MSVAGAGLAAACAPLARRGAGALSAGAVSGLLSMAKYQLVTISPQSIVTALEQIGELDPSVSPNEEG